MYCEWEDIDFVQYANRPMSREEVADYIDEFIMPMFEENENEK